MVKRFLLILFDVFIGFVVFISLFQYSAAHLNLGGFENVFNENNYFGFYSLFSFTNDLGNNTDFIDAWNDAVTWFRNVLDWFLENIQDTWEQITHANNAFKSIIQGFRLIALILIAPIVILVGLGGFIIYLLRFIWLVLSMFFKLLTGQYNTPIVHYGYISSSVSLFNGVYSF